MFEGEKGKTKNEGSVLRVNSSNAGFVVGFTGFTIIDN